MQYLTKKEFAQTKIPTNYIDLAYLKNCIREVFNFLLEKKSFDLSFKLCTTEYKCDLPFIITSSLLFPGCCRCKPLRIVRDSCLEG
jgi:hypothetical protein